MRWSRTNVRWPRVGALTATALLAWACGKDGVVGGACRKGLSECNLQCVDLQQDDVHCGSCDRACTVGQRCSAGTCTSSEASADVAGGDVGADATETDDAALGDGRPFDDAPPDVSDGGIDVSIDVSTDVSSDVSRDGATDGTADNMADGVTDDATDGSSDAPPCLPPYNTPEQCGDCATRCVDPTPLCGLDGTYKCVARCSAPLVLCGAVCVDTASDERNCGGCTVVCPSGICQAGGCVGKGYGHEIMIGTDYADSTLLSSSAQVTMLGNAIFQSVATNVRVLAYDEYADPAVVSRIEGWITTMAAARGKSVTLTKAPNWSVVPQRLTVEQYQAFLVYDQALAPTDQMATTGTLWNAALSAFAKGGGIIVALDGGSAGRMRDFLTNGGLLPVTDETDVTGTQLNVDAPTDVVGQNLPNVFAAKRNTVAFTTTQVRDNYHVFVVTDSTGLLPIVVHAVPRP